jgi:hypothetical protein
MRTSEQLIDSDLASASLSYPDICAKAEVLDPELNGFLYILNE